MTGPVKNVGAWSIRTILENDKGLGRLVTGRRAFRTCHLDDRSRHRYFFGGTRPLPFTLRFWLCKRQRRQQCAADEDRNCFLHLRPPLDGCTLRLVTLYKGIPKRALHDISLSVVSGLSYRFLIETDNLNTHAENGAGRSDVFPSTHWSAVFAARGSQAETEIAGAALAKLCQVYWAPLYGFVRSRGHTVHDAQDLTQSFFAYVLEHKVYA